MATAPVLAHLGPLSLLLSWLLAATVAALYVAGCRRRGPPPLAVASGGMALVAYLVATVPAMAAWADASFAGHMVQHLLLVSVVPPLVVLARPARPLRLGARAVSPALARAARPASGLASPGVVAGGVAVLAAGTLWVWHVPALYEAAVASEVVHGVEHATLLGTSLAVWLAATGRRTPHQVGLVALLVTAVAGATLGGVLTFAPRPLYGVHDGVADPLVDQQWAGVLMWVPGGAVPLAAATLLAADWVRVATRRVERREQARVAAFPSRPLGQ